MDAAVEFLPEYEEELRGLEEFSHIVILACLHKSRVLPFVVGPKRVEGAPKVGVFAIGSPDRPNPIANVYRPPPPEGALYVDGIDLFDGTPVLDIKGFSPRRCPESPKAPWWAD